MQISKKKKKKILVPTRERVHQVCILSTCLFHLYAEYIIKNAELDETQAGLKSPRSNINNLRCADDTTLMEETKEIVS